MGRNWNSKPRKAKKTRPSTSSGGAGARGAFYLPRSSEPLSSITQKSNGKYVSDCDPSQQWDTHQDALDYERSLPVSDPVSAGRARTLFTYTSKKSHNKLGTRAIPNGPHTVGNAALEFSLFGAVGQISMHSLFHEQVRTPKKWRKAVQSQMGGAVMDGKSEMSLRILRAYRDYVALYRQLIRVLKGRDTSVDAIDLIHELIELDPYTVYKYWAPDTATKKDTKGKGENNDLTNPKNIDTRGKFKDGSEYRETVEDRMLLLDDDFVSDEEEDSESEDEASESEDEESEFEYDDGDIVTLPPQREEREIAVNDEIYAYSPDEIANDGDCFFNSLIALGVRGSVASLRQLALNNGGQPTITNPGEWAAERDFRAVARALGIRIQVVVLDLGYQFGGIRTFGNGATTYTLAHVFGGHFVPMRNDA